MARSMDADIQPLTSADVLQSSNVNEEDMQIKGVKYRYYTLPFPRFLNVIRAVLLLDGIVSIILWLAGGYSTYFVDSILHFHFLASVFDMAIITGMKDILLIILYSTLEDWSFEQIKRPLDIALNKKTRLLKTSVLLSSLIFFAYSWVKGSLVLNAYLNNPQYKLMHVTYNALLISSLCFCTLEMLLSVYSFHAMKKLKLIRVLHQFNELRQELDETGNPMKKKVNIRRLFSLAKPEAGLLFVAMLALFASSASMMAAPLFFGMVVDSSQKSMADLNRTVLILMGIYVAGSLAGMFRAWLFTLAGQRLVARLRKELFCRIIEQEIAFFDTNRTGELMNRLSSDSQVLQNAVTVNISMLARQLLQIIGSIVLMFVLKPDLTGVLLAVVPIISLLAVQYGKYVRDLRKNFQDRLADASTTAEESISSVRTVRSFAAEGKSQRLYGTDIDKSYQVGKKLALAEGAFNGIIGILAYGAICVVLWYGGKLVYEKQLTAGVLTSFLLYTLQVALAFAMLSSLYGDFMQAVGASVRIFELLERQSQLPTQGGLILSQFNGAVAFDDVHFIYPSRPETEVLTGVSFDIEPGEVVALVGPSGGGKSTLVSLIERFYDPGSGVIQLGNANLNLLDPHWFRQKISMVSQEPTLFACSVKDNISYGIDENNTHGRNSVTFEQIIEAAKQANAHDFIMSFEQGYDTPVGEKGIRLSGGQKQRIAIARALLMDPVLLLLDEATSALDAESEFLVQEAIDRAMKHRTVLVIAHRLSTVRNASKVIVIDRGCIAEQGTHDELLAKDGVYKKLVLRQLTAGVSSGVALNQITGMVVHESTSRSSSPETQILHEFTISPLKTHLDEGNATSNTITFITDIPPGTKTEVGIHIERYSPSPKNNNALTDADGFSCSSSSGETIASKSMEAEALRIQEQPHVSRDSNIQEDRAVDSEVYLSCSSNDDLLAKKSEDF